MTVTFKPLLNNLLLELEPEPEPSKLIAVQRSLEGLARFGRILSIGPEVREVKVGQRVLASVTAGAEVADGIVMISEAAVLGLCHQ